MEKDTRRYEPPRNISPQEAKRIRMFNEKMLRVRMSLEQVLLDEVDKQVLYAVDFKKNTSPWEVFLVDDETGDAMSSSYSEFMEGVKGLIGPSYEKDHVFTIIHLEPDPKTPGLQVFKNENPGRSLQIERTMTNLPFDDKKADFLLIVDRYFLPNNVVLPFAEVATFRRFDKGPHLYPNRLE